MKKLLALVLALVMSMSLVTISNADFKDADKIDYTEAVDVMNAVGVLIGDENGNFNPKDNLTRAQAAKIISYLLLGNKTAEGLAGSGKFTDVAANSWSAGFVDYCAATGVVAGVGNGKFDPNGSLTTLQFAKMLLVALGYDAKIEGFVGTDWSINVSAKANQVGLLNGLDVGANATLTREQAAKMCLNTLKAPLVEYDTKGTTVTVGGDASVTVGASKAEFKTSTNKKAQTISNDVINGTTAYTVEFAEEYYTDLRLNKKNDDFGRNANEWKYKATTIGTYADDSDLQETYTAKAKRGDLYNLIGSSVVDGIKKDKYGFEVYVDGQKVANPNPDNYFVKNSSSATGTNFTDGISGNGVLTEVYMDNDSNVKIVVIYTYLMQATADYNSTKGTLNVETVDNGATVPALPATIDNDDVDVSSFKEDDYILVTYSRSAKEVKSAVKAEIVTGEVTEYTVTDEVTLGGTKYSYNKTVGSSADGQSGTLYTIKEKATVVLDKYGYIIYVDDALASNSYVFIKEAKQAVGVGNRVAADAYFTDGTNETIILKKVDGSTSLTGKMDAKGSWWIFTKDSNGEYTLNPMKSSLTKVVGTAKASGTAIAVIKNDKINFMPNVAETAAKAVKGNSSTMFIVVEADGTVTATTGIKNAPDVTTGASAPNSGENATVTAAVKANGYAEYVFVDMSNDAKAKVDGSENAADYMLLLKYTGNKTTDVNNDTYYKYKVLFDGQETEKYIESNLLPGGVKDHAGLLFRNVKQNSKGFVTGATKFDDNVTGVAAPAVPGKRVEITLNTGKVSIEKDVLTLASKSFYAADAKVNLLIGTGANGDLIDQGKDYQLYQTSAKAAASILKDYKLDVNGTVDSKAYVLLDDNGSEIATDVYIYVAKATYDGTSSSSSSTTYTLADDTLMTTATGKLGFASGADVQANSVADTMTNVTVNYEVSTWNASKKVWEVYGTYSSGKVAGPVNAIDSAFNVTMDLPDGESIRVDATVTSDQAIIEIRTQALKVVL